MQFRGGHFDISMDHSLDIGQKRCTLEVKEQYALVSKAVRSSVSFAQANADMTDVADETNEDSLPAPEQMQVCFRNILLLLLLLLPVLLLIGRFIRITSISSFSSGHLCSFVYS